MTQRSKRPRPAQINSRSIAYELLMAVYQDDAYANLLLPKMLTEAKLEDRDSAFAQELAFGTIRWQLFYDAIIERCAGRSTSEIDLAALVLLRLGTHQLLAMRVPSHAALSETVELAKQVLNVGAAGFVNGVLRRVSEKDRDTWLQLALKSVSDSNEALAIEYSHPVWVVRALRQALKSDGRESEIAELLAADNAPAMVSVIALPGLATQEDLIDSGMLLGSASPIGAEIPSGDPHEYSLIRSGKARVQDQGSQLAGLALIEVAEVRAGEEWLDLCAGPGGKAALLAAVAQQHESKLFCNELLPHRAKLVEQALSQVNPNVYVRVGDGRQLGEDAPESFDRILLDAPCTGLGALRRRPESRWRKHPSDVAELAKVQQELFESAWLGLKPGGILAYVTCSPHPAETTAIIDWAEKSFGSALELLDATATLAKINPRLALNRSRKTVQLWPHVNGTDAMFIALMRKSLG